MELTSRRSRLTAARYISRTELLRSLIIINVIINFIITITMMMIMMIMIMIIRNNCRTEVLLSLNLINGMRDFSNEFLDLLMKSIKIANNPFQLKK